jgi:biopolymer transport protein ExbD
MLLDQGLAPRSPRIELVPLIDVLFLLLIFFFYSIFNLVEQRALPVELVSAGTSISQTHQPELIVIDREGRIYLESEPVDFSKIKVHFQGLEPEEKVLIRADGESPIRLGLRILDLARAAGLIEVAFETLPDNRKP